MIKSMTGFGRGEYSDGKRSVTVEIKTVNHRYSDINVKMPKRYSFAEEQVKAIVKKMVKRGKAEVGIIVENITDSDVMVKLNMPVAEQYKKNLTELKEGLELDGNIDVRLISLMPDVLKNIPDVENEEEVAAAICKATEMAVSKHDEMRIVEGEKLAADLKMRGEYIREIVKKIDERAPQIQKEYADRLYNRIAEIIEGSVEIPKDRILVEAAIFADKSNITEELVRLDSHMAQLDDFLTNSNEPIGKKLDFLVQEMNREANTIGSKANDLELTSLMLDTKSEIEKIREQIQNIE